MKYWKTAFCAFAFVLAGSGMSCVAAEPSAPTTFPAEVAEKPRTEISVKFTLVGEDGEKREVRLMTMEGSAVTYGNFNHRSYNQPVDNMPSVPEIRPATLQTGLSVYAEPGRINDNGRVVVRFRVEDSSLESLRDVHGSTVQLPDIRTIALDQTILMKSGVPVHLDAIRDGKKASGIEVEVEYLVPVEVSAASVAESAANEIKGGAPCPPNGLVTFAGVLMLCDGGKWTAQDASVLQRQAATLPESLFGGAFKKAEHPSSVMATTAHGVQVGSSYFYGDDSNSSIRQAGGSYIQSLAGDTAAPIK